MHKTKPELLAEEITRLMSDNQHWTVAAVAKALEVTEERVRVAMRKLLNTCVIYHSQRIEPSHTNAYRLISAAQATSSDLTVERVDSQDAKREEKIDQRYRRQEASWPRGDDLLIRAMHAMVCCRQSAMTDN
ncbi:hypothetical protein [Burkholderia territorii]|uniref:hypothetical protein n=1 Tax=Burkholderia territorii TaxID=1503055 RepID=UPI00075F61D4|nr:hypothetical protein [Burkholderia territorii]KWO60430.1 hypothetical protein WT98_30825 [Burkholderia territorii]